MTTEGTALERAIAQAHDKTLSQAGEVVADFAATSWVFKKEA